MNRNEPITRNSLSSLKTGKRYQFEFKTGQTMMIYLTSVDEQGLTGYPFQRGDVILSRKNHYTDSFDNLEKNLRVISRKKFDPLLTTLAIGIPVAIGIYVADRITIFSWPATP